MTAQQTFEELLHMEGKLNEFAALSTMASRPQERFGILEALIDGSQACRKRVDSLLIAFEAMPAHFKPVVDKFAELRKQMLRREDGWKKIVHQFKHPPGGKNAFRKSLPSDAVMSTASWLCQRVEEPLGAIVWDLQGLAAASAVEAFARWCVSEPVEPASQPREPPTIIKEHYGESLAEAMGDALGLDPQELREAADEAASPNGWAFKGDKAN